MGEDASFPAIGSAADSILCTSIFDDVDNDFAIVRKATAKLPVPSVVPLGGDLELTVTKGGSFLCLFSQDGTPECRAINDTRPCP
jgi:hypothetical protein